MVEFVADCPRCGSRRITFDVTQEHLLGTKYGWQHVYEAFCICRLCHKSTIFLLAQASGPAKEIVHQAGLMGLQGAINRYMDNKGPITLKDVAAEAPPEYLPEDIDAAFREGARALAAKCPNAAGAMFRLCIDLATKGMLPNAADGLNAAVRAKLGLRLTWLFDNHLLPEGLRELSTCVKDDGNDGVHDGTLSDADADDLLDFTKALLERLYTEPQRLALAGKRRVERRATKSS
jgi:hypothetical protein